MSNQLWLANHDSKDVGYSSPEAIYIYIKSKSSASISAYVAMKVNLHSTIKLNAFQVGKRSFWHIIIGYFRSRIS